MIEIERRYVLDALPAGLHDGEHQKQSYILVTGPLEIRVRSGRIHVMTFKVAVPGPHVPMRLELELRLPAILARRLHRPVSQVEKTRFTTLDSDGNRWEVDQYAGDLHGLITAEIEIDRTRGLATCPWPSREVTGNSFWTNRSLSRYGLPKE